MSKIQEIDTNRYPDARIIRSVNVNASNWKVLQKVCDKHGYKMSRIFDNLVGRFIRDKS
tara:strand:- start:256 stop:432 length:177 start_codon:yes stop_codon:yes gene_type:complete